MKTPKPGHHFTINANDEWTQHRPTEITLSQELWRIRSYERLYLAVQVVPRHYRQDEKVLHFADWAECRDAILSPENLEAAEVLAVGYLHLLQSEHQIVREAEPTSWTKGLDWQALEREVEEAAAELESLPLRKFLQERRLRLELVRCLMRVMVESTATARLLARLLIPPTALAEMDQVNLRAGINWLAEEGLLVLYDLREEGIYLELI
jgi:hypothetical protein